MVMHVQTKSQDVQLTDFFGSAAYVSLWLSCCAIIMAIPAFVLYRIIFWLRNGHWFSYTILDFFNYEKIDLGLYEITWLGVRKIYLNLLQLPFEFGLLFVAIMLASLFALYRLRGI
jgi:hypothetical protein